MASGELSPRGTPTFHGWQNKIITYWSFLPASVASSSELSLVDPAAAGKLLSKKDKVPGTVKLKKSIAKKTKPKDGEGNGELGWCYVFIFTINIWWGYRVKSWWRDSKPISGFRNHKWHWHWPQIFLPIRPTTGRPPWHDPMQALQEAHGKISCSISH